MARRANEPKNDLILEALRSRLARAEMLHLRKKHSYLKAIRTIEAHQGQIKTQGQLLKYTGRRGAETGFSQQIYEEVIDAVWGNADINAPRVTPSEIERAQRRRPPPGEGYVPSRGAGAYAILLAMREAEREDGLAQYKADIQRRAQPYSRESMYQPGPQGFSSWKGISKLQDERYVIRERWSRQGGNFGQRRDEFFLTDQGRKVAERLWWQRDEQRARELGIHRPPEDDQNDLYRNPGAASGATPGLGALSLASPPGGAGGGGASSSTPRKRRFAALGDGGLLPAAAPGGSGDEEEEEDFRLALRRSLGGSAAAAAPRTPHRPPRGPVSLEWSDSGGDEDGDGPALARALAASAAEARAAAAAAARARARAAEEEEDERMALALSASAAAAAAARKGEGAAAGGGSGVGDYKEEEELALAAALSASVRGGGGEEEEDAALAAALAASAAEAGAAGLLLGERAGGGGGDGGDGLSRGGPPGRSGPSSSPSSPPRAAEAGGGCSRYDTPTQRAFEAAERRCGERRLGKRGGGGGGRGRGKGRLEGRGELLLPSPPGLGSAVGGRPSSDSDVVLLSPPPPPPPPGPGGGGGGAGSERAAAAAAAAAGAPEERTVVEEEEEEGDERKLSAEEEEGRTLLVSLVMDRRERETDAFYQRMFVRLGQVIACEAPVTAARLAVEQAQLPVGDFLWTVRRGGGGGAEEAEAHDPAALRGARVLPYLVERKTVRDLVGRSARGDHRRQLARMAALRAIFPVQFFFIENSPATAHQCNAYGTGWRPDPRRSICDERGVYRLELEMLLDPAAPRVVYTGASAEGTHRHLRLLTRRLLLAAPAPAPAPAPRRPGGGAPTLLAAALRSGTALADVGRGGAIPPPPPEAPAPYGHSELTIFEGESATSPKCYILLPETRIMILRVSGRCFIEAIENLDMEPTAGSKVWVNSVYECFSAMGVLEPHQDEYEIKVLIIDNVWRAVGDLYKRRAKDSSHSYENSDDDEGMEDAVVAWILALTLDHGFHVHPSDSVRSSETFLEVVQDHFFSLPPLLPTPSTPPDEASSTDPATGEGGGELG